MKLYHETPRLLLCCDRGESNSRPGSARTRHACFFFRRCQPASKAHRSGLLVLASGPDRVGRPRSARRSDVRRSRQATTLDHPGKASSTSGSASSLIPDPLPYPGGGHVGVFRLRLPPVRGLAAGGAVPSRHAGP